VPPFERFTRGRESIVPAFERFTRGRESIVPPFERFPGRVRWARVAGDFGDKQESESDGSPTFSNFEAVGADALRSKFEEATVGAEALRAPFGDAAAVESELELSHDPHLFLKNSGMGAVAMEVF